MDDYVLWFARLERYYQILLAAALVTGFAAVAVGTGTQNFPVVVAGLLWILGGSGVVWVADRREQG
ncbi:MAG: hypothetical protein ACI9CA_002169 [Natronomonas sp.]|jgi:hypothetical protein